MSFSRNVQIVVGEVLVEPKTHTLNSKQKQYFHDNLFNAIEDNIKNNDDRIIVAPAHTGSGKTYTIVNDTILSYAKKYVSCSLIIVIAPDKGCVDDPYVSFEREYNNTKFVDIQGTKKELKVLTKDDVRADLENTDTNRVLVTSCVPVYVAFLSTQYFNSLYDSYDPLTSNVKLPDLVIADEIHHGLGTPSSDTIYYDQGRRNINYDPVWFNTIKNMRTMGTRVLGFTATTTQSQQEKTVEGADNFKILDSMPKDRDSSTFTERVLLDSSPKAGLKTAKEHIENKISYIRKIAANITDDTWKKATSLNIEFIMPGSIFKLARGNSKKGRSMQGIGPLLFDWAWNLGIDVATSTTDSKKFRFAHKNKSSLPQRYDHSVDIIREANSPTRSNVPLLLTVIESGNMGWNIPRIKTVVNLTVPSQKRVSNMQVQLCGRGTRLLFRIESHDEMSKSIAQLDVSDDQKRLLAEYVCIMSTNTIMYLESDIMHDAYRRISENTYTAAEGLELYMNAINANSRVVSFPKNVVTIKGKKYDANKLNQRYKESQCTACPRDPVTNIPYCEICTRNAVQLRLGRPVLDDEWRVMSVRMLELNHGKNGRYDYSTGNLETVCANFHAIITEINEDHLCHYENTSRVD